MGGLTAPAQRCFVTERGIDLGCAAFREWAGAAVRGGEIVYAIGEQGTPAWLVLRSGINILRRDKLSHQAQVTTHHAGRFTGEVSWRMQCSGSGACGDVRVHALGASSKAFEAHVMADGDGDSLVGAQYASTIELTPDGLRGLETYGE